MTIFVLGTPRSRTAWLATFLSYQGVEVEHEASSLWKGLADLDAAMLRPSYGVSDTCLGLLWKHLTGKGQKVVVIRRSLPKVQESFHKLGINTDMGMLELLDRHLQEAGYFLTKHSYWFEDLHSEEVCKRIFEYCLEKPWDREWWLGLRGKNIQCDVESMLARIESNRDGLLNLYGAELRRG